MSTTEPITDSEAAPAGTCPVHEFNHYLEKPYGEKMAFYDAIRTNDAAVIELGDDTLKRIAHDLVDIVRRDAKTDWAVKEQVRAKLRAAVRRLLLRYGYPPDQQEEATVLVLRQAEVLAGEVAA